MLICNINMIGICNINIYSTFTKRYLTFIFKMKDLSEVDIILSITVKKYSSNYALNQPQKVKSLYGLK